MSFPVQVIEDTIGGEVKGGIEVRYHFSDDSKLLAIECKNPSGSPYFKVPSTATDEQVEAIKSYSFLDVIKDTD